MSPSSRVVVQRSEMHVESMSNSAMGVSTAKVAFDVFDEVAERRQRPRPGGHRHRSRQDQHTHQGEEDQAMSGITTEQSSSEPCATTEVRRRHFTSLPICSPCDAASAGPSKRWKQRLAS